MRKKIKTDKQLRLQTDGDSSDLQILVKNQNEEISDLKIQIDEQKLTVKHLREKLKKKEQKIEHLRNYKHKSIEYRLKSLFSFSPKGRKDSPPSYRASSHHTTVVCWELSHNPVGRAFLFADFMKSQGDTTLVGPTFDKYGKHELWTPLKGYPIKTSLYPSGNFPDFLVQARKIALDSKPTDLVIICKPRLPSILIGLLIAKKHGSRIILDIDDHELSFFNNQTPLPLNKIDQYSIEDLLEPYNEIWTRICEGLIPSFQSRVVSNLVLMEKFTGELIPHVRDERTFDPSIYNSRKLKAALGFGEAQKIILFLGTPRPHKGFALIPKALKSIGNPDYKFLIVGNNPDKKAEEKYKNEWDDFVVFESNSSFKKLPEYLAIADLICLLQDPKSPISEYQIPAKVFDAISMGIPVLSTDVPPLKGLIKQRLIESIDDLTFLPETIDRMLSDSSYRARAMENRRIHFLKQFSYQYASTKIMSLYKNSASFGEQHERILNRISGSMKFSAQSFDLVFFWKQNDTGLYGRRSDMVAKYLSMHPNVRKLILFDAPIDHKKLLNKQDKTKQSKHFQDNEIFERTINRFKGVEGSTSKIREYCYIYETPNKALNQKEKKALRLEHLDSRQNYMTFVEQVLTNEGVADVNSLFWFCPTVYETEQLLKTFNPGFIVSDFIDDQRQWANNPESLQRIEENYSKILEVSNVVLCNNENVHEELLEKRKDAVLVENGLEKMTQEYLNELEKPSEFQMLLGPIIGYVGNLDPTRLDIALIKKIAIENENWNVVLIGSAHVDETILELNKVANIHMLGVITSDECRAYIRHFDVAIIPHINNSMTRSMNPLKTFVYHSLGCPIVSTELSGLSLSEKDGLYIGNDHTDFIAKIKYCLANKQKLEIKVANKKSTWAAKVDQVVNLIKSKS